MEHLTALHPMLLRIDLGLGLKMLVFISEIDLYFDIEFSSGDSYRFIRTKKSKRKNHGPKNVSEP
jgi:hypothetical protein